MQIKERGKLVQSLKKENTLPCLRNRRLVWYSKGGEADSRGKARKVGRWPL